MFQQRFHPLLEFPANVHLVFQYPPHHYKLRATIQQQIKQYIPSTLSMFILLTRYSYIKDITLNITITNNFHIELKNTQNKYKILAKIKKKIKHYIHSTFSMFIPLTKYCYIKNITLSITVKIHYINMHLDCYCI